LKVFHFNNTTEIRDVPNDVELSIETNPENEENFFAFSN